MFRYTKMLTMNVLLLSFVCLLYGQSTLAKSSEKYTKKNMFKMENGHLVKVPKKFELAGEDAAAEFARIVKDIHFLTKNASATYWIKVEVPKGGKRKNIIKSHFEHAKSKHSNKFNVPLSKKNMKLSNYELFMKKMSENDEPAQAHVNRPVQMPTTVAEVQVMTTKQLSNGKYKPIIHKYRTNYTKRIKPVKNDVITLITNEFHHPQ